MRKPHKVASKKQRTQWNWKTRYGMTVEEVQSMIDKQEGQCAICKKVLGNDFRVDHDHNTGDIRGLLCHHCNLLIAGIENKDFYERAIGYLTTFNALQFEGEAKVAEWIMHRIVQVEVAQ